MSTRLSGLRRQIILSLTVMVLGVMLLSLVGTYVFYGIVSTYLPESISDSWVPSEVELAWIVGTTLAALLLAGSVALRLARRILPPLNAVAHSLREVAQGNLGARAELDPHALGESAQLVHDFNAMAERLQSVTREQQFWNAAVAHELRTPVTILRGRLQGLAEGVFSPSPAMFEGLLRQVEGLSRLIEDLRVLSLNDSDHLQLDLATTRLAPEVAIVVQAFAGELEARGFVLQLELDEQVQAPCDAVRIRQALMALLENALKHAEPGPLKVSAGIVDGTCRLSVEDSGPGIAPELAAQVFEAFRRGDPSRSRQSGGTGLGLAVVKAIVEAHGGHARCHPGDTGGTCFVLDWPVQVGQGCP